MNQSLIVIDGKTYNSVNEMPPDVRAKYDQAMRVLKDREQDGTPDVFNASSSTQVFSNAMKFVVNGHEYNNIEDLPPEARAKYEQAMGTLDKNRNGIPDFVEGMMGMMPLQTPDQTSSSPISSPRSATRAPQPASPTISPDTSNGWMLVLAGGLLLLLCAAGAFGVWYFLLR